MGHIFRIISNFWHNSQCKFRFFVEIVVFGFEHVQENCKKALEKHFFERRKIILKIESRTCMCTIQGGEKSEYEKRIKMLSKMNKISRCITFFNA